MLSPGSLTILARRDGIAVYTVYNDVSDAEETQKANASFDFPSRPEAGAGTCSDSPVSQKGRHRASFDPEPPSNLNYSGGEDDGGAVLEGDQEGERAEITVSEATAIVQLSGPCGVATDPQGRIILLDYQRDRVQLVTRNGAVIASCPAHGKAATGFTVQDIRFADSVLEPCQGAIDDEGKLAVIKSDAGECAVVVYAL